MEDQEIRERARNIWEVLNEAKEVGMPWFSLTKTVLLHSITYSMQAHEGDHPYTTYGRLV